MKVVPIGTVVTVQAPGSRGTEGETRTIPAIVLSQWPDGSLELFAFHFEGSFLMRSIPVDDVHIVSQALGDPRLKFSMAS